MQTWWGWERFSHRRLLRHLDHTANKPHRSLRGAISIPEQNLQITISKHFMVDSIDEERIIC